MDKGFFKDMESAWRNAAPTENNELPEGDYQCRIETAQIKEGKSGQPVLNWGLRIVSGQYANRMLFKMQSFSVAALPYLKADLELLRICPETLSGLEAQLPHALDAVIDIRLKRGTLKDGSTIQKVYFNRLVREGQHAAQTVMPDGFTAVTGDDLPWESE